MPVRAVPVPALEDNYMYVVIDEETKQCGVVDPVDASAMITAAEREGATITAILTTHSHWDHAGGNVELKKRCASVEVVYGGAGDGVAGCTKELNDGDTFALGNSTVQVISTPCHTPGHICYLVDGNVFTGDTMFVSGCGNFNSGTPAQMAAAFSLLPLTRAPKGGGAALSTSNRVGDLTVSAGAGLSSDMRFGSDPVGARSSIDWKALTRPGSSWEMSPTSCESIRAAAASLELAA